MAGTDFRCHAERQLPERYLRNEQLRDRPIPDRVDMHVAIVDRYARSLAARAFEQQNDNLVALRNKFLRFKLFEF